MRSRKERWNDEEICKQRQVGSLKNSQQTHNEITSCILTSLQTFRVSGNAGSGYDCKTSSDIYSELF